MVNDLCGKKTPDADHRGKPKNPNMRAEKRLLWSSKITFF
jgi:hypothetical protein